MACCTVLVLSPEGIACLPSWCCAKLVLAIVMRNTSNNERPTVQFVVRRMERYRNDIGLDVAATLDDNEELQLFPVPATNRLTLSYRLPCNDDISMDLLDQRGVVVSVLMSSSPQQAGLHQRSFELSDRLAAGSYLVRLRGQHVLCIGKVTVE